MGNPFFVNLRNAVTTHTTSVLKALKDNGVTPDWVQVGNETGDGMLWPDGRASLDMANYAMLSNAGYNAVKAIFPNCKVMIHINNGWNNSLFRWIFDGPKCTRSKMGRHRHVAIPEQHRLEFVEFSMFEQYERHGEQIWFRSHVVRSCMDWRYPEACKLFLADLSAKSNRSETKKASVYSTGT